MIKVDNQTIYWTNFYPPYNGFQNNVRCTYNLTIPNNRAVSLAPVVWGLETNVDVLQFYRSKNDVVQIPESLHREASVYLLEPNYDEIEKNVLLEFKTDGSILSSIFSLHLTFLDCKCISQISCKASLRQGILAINNPLYCGYLKCNITILPCSTAYGHMNLNVNVFDHNTLFDVFRIISNDEIVLQIDNSNRGFTDGFEVYLYSSNTNILEAITSPSVIAGYFYVTYEPFNLPPSDLHIYLTTSSPYYIIDFREHNLPIVEICDTLKSKNLSIIVYEVDVHQALDLIISNNESLTYNLKGSYHCFSDYLNYASYKCKIKRDKIALFEPAKQNIVAVTLSNTTFSNVSALSTRDGNCDIIFLVESAHVITMLWTTAVRENVKVFAGFDKTKLYFEFNSNSAKKWKSIVLLSPYYIIEIPKSAALLIEVVRYESTVITLDYPYSSLLATPDFGSSNLMNAINVTYHGSTNTTLKFTAIYSNISATNSSFYFHSMDSNMTDIISHINKTGDSITFHSSVVNFVYIAANFISLVNEGAIFLIETIKTEMNLISFIFGFTTLTTFISLSTADVKVLSPEDKCIANIRKEIKDRKVSRNLGGIVGIGWDSLTNRATLPVFSQTYHQCRTVPDGDFLIPDNIVVFPIKEANIQKSSQIFESFNDYKTSTGVSFGVSAGGGIPGIASASGSFSLETKIGKEHMEKNKQTGFSNKIEYHAFDLIGTEKAGFDEVFTMRLNDIRKAIEDKNMLLAQYEAESIIGDYGTHVTNKALAGASITMLGFSETTEETDKHTFSLKMSAQFHASFLGAVSMGFKAGAENDEEDESGTKSSSDQTYIITKGGPDVNRLFGNNAENKMQIDSVVGLTREGMPIYSYIHPGVLKGGNWSDEMTFVVQDLLYNATQEYIRHNTIPGCTITTLPEYFYKANSDYFQACGSGAPSATELSYMGGYYQECEYMESHSAIHRNLTNGNQCDQYRHLNPLIYEYKCPENSEIISATSFFVTFKDRVYMADIGGCNSSDCSRNFTITDRINVTVYACSTGFDDNNDDNYQFRMIFGGIFGNVNIFSDNGRCSTGFTEYPIFHNSKICLAPSWSNEYLDDGYPNLLLKGVILNGFVNCLNDYECDGTKYYLTTINNCAYYYCVNVPNGNFNDSSHPILDSPPYISRDDAMSKTRLNFQHEIDDLENGDDDDKGEMMLTKEGQKVGKIISRFNIVGKH